MADKTTTDEVSHWFIFAIGRPEPNNLREGEAEQTIRRKGTQSGRAQPQGGGLWQNSS